MSFRRPKKPVRPRVVMLNAGDSDEEDDQKMDVDSPPPPPIITKKKNGHEGGGGKLSFEDDNEVISFNKPNNKKTTTTIKDNNETSSKAATLLSFDDELDGEEQEVFQVRKSSVSRRLMKQRDKEKKGSGGSSSSSHSSSSKSKNPFGSSSNNQKDDKSAKFQSQVDGFISQIKIKQEVVIKTEQTSARILNGREAEALHMESEDDEDDDDNYDEDENNGKGGGSTNLGGHKFRRPAAGGGAAIQDAVRRALEQGQIPDANLIHEARKRKQMAREMGGGSAAEFVPVDNVDRLKKEKGRLVREDDDNDQSDEERLDFSSATNAAKIDRDKRIEDFNAAQDRQDSEDDSDPEADEWESQQISKGVSKAKAQEMYNQGYLESPSSQPCFYNNNTNQDTPTGFSFYPPQNSEPKKKGKTQAFMEQTQKIASIEEVINGSKKITPELILKQMSDRLQRLRLSKDRNAGELSRVEADLQLAEKELNEANGVKSDLNSRFIMYQNLRGYVTDLVDCLRCKIPEIEHLEQRMVDVMKSRRDRFADRRRQDVRDQTDEVAATINIMGGNPVSMPPPTNPERTRRAAEREGRRTRRRRLREKEYQNGIPPHKDGLSSDDEEPDIEFKAYFATRENIVGEAQAVFEDVHEDFGTMGGILSRFEEWKENDSDAYRESYAYMCLPKCVAPFIRLQLISWDPLREGCDFVKQPWMKCLLSYAYKRNESIEELTTDPDCRLIPSVVEKVVLPWISRIVEARWDPMSGSQTRGLVNALNRLIDEYAISPNSKPIHSLMETIINRLKESVENDIYVPIYAKSALANTFTPASVYLSRQFWSSVKLLDNMSKWQGLLNDRPLQALALDALLTRYTLLGIRLAPDLSESAERVKGVVNVLPRAWLSRENNTDIPNGLQQLNRCLVLIVQTADCTVAANRIAIPDLSNVMKTIGFNDEAQIILRKYS